MAMPASGAITFAQLQTEFGGANPISLSEYYNGGAYVANGAVPSSGTISLSQFYGLSAEQITLGASYTVASTGAGTQTPSFTLESDGDIVRATTPLGSADIGDWINPKAAAPSDYEVRATLNSGTLSSGTTGSWLALSTTRAWTLTRFVVGAADPVELTIEIRKGSGSVLDSTTVTLDAERF